jgi:ADP-ribose pyrophosphatase
LVRQYRHPVGLELWEIPAGTADPGESTLDGALRELAEETGYRAGSARVLGSLYMTPGFCDEIMHFVYAHDLTLGLRNLDDDERIEVEKFSIQEAERLVECGKIADAKTIIALMWLSKRGELAPSRADN